MALTQRNIWRRAQAAKVREGRVITGYLEVKYPEIYAEAIAFYNGLNEKYPNKCDVRKTIEFINLKSSAPVGESQKQKKEYRKKSYPNMHLPSTKSFKDNLELRIQLMQPQTKASDSQPEPDTTELMESTSVEPAEITINELQPTLNVEFSDDTIDKIIADLQKDAELTAFFDNLQEDADLTSFFDDDIDIPVDIPELTPLEAELLTQ